MAPLPRARLKIAPPFSSIAIDFAGPFEVHCLCPKQHLCSECGTQLNWCLSCKHQHVDSTGKKIYKSTACLFVCHLTRALHVESLVANHTAENFLLALQRFASIYGMPSRIHSDNGEQLKLGNRQLSRLYKELNEERIKKKLAVPPYSLEWHFANPVSPYQSGLVERLVRSWKEPFVRVLGGRVYSQTEITTIAYACAQQVNNRPLAPMSQSIDDVGIPFLTPSHLLRGHYTTPLAADNEHLLEDNTKRIDVQTRWKMRQQITTNFILHTRSNIYFF